MKEESAYHTISETSEKLNIPSHVLRFWEKKFSFIKPRKGKGGRRYYNSTDMENILIIKSLLYDRGFTILGAINYLKKNNKKNEEFMINKEKNLKETLLLLEKAKSSLKKIKYRINNL